MQGGFLELVRGVFPTLQSQLLGTAGVVLTLLVLGETVRRLGPWLKARFSDVAVETVQATLMAVLALVAGGVMIVIWRATPQLLLVMEVLNFTRTDAIKAAFTMALLAGSYALTRGTKELIGRLAQERGAISEHQQEVAHHLVQIGVFLLVFFVVLSLWRIPIGNLLLGAGFLGVIVGLAARQTLGAVLAGFVVLFARPFELGDWIEINDREGIVQDISIVNTRIKTFDDEIVLIPNDIVTSTEIVNRSRSGRYRVDVDIGVDYGTDLDDAVEVAEAVLDEAELPMEKPTPYVILTEFGASAVVLRLRFWISNPTSGRMWRAKTEVIDAVKDAFDAEGIKIPFPQRELMARQAEGGFRLSGEIDAAEIAAIADQQTEDGESTRQRDEVESDEGPRQGEEPRSDAGTNLDGTHPDGTTDRTESAGEPDDSDTTHD